MNVFMIISVLIIAIGCNNSSGSKSKNSENSDRDGNTRGTQGGDKRPVEWDSISKDYNTEIFEMDFDISDLKYINLNIIGISKEVYIIPSKTLESIGKLKVYRAWSEQGNFGRLDLDTVDQRLRVSNITGNQAYSCSRTLTGRRLLSLSGGCNFYVEVLLPSSLKIEIYSSGTLVSKRYFPVTVDQLTKELERGFNTEKMEAVENFIKSYVETEVTLKLSSIELQEILTNFGIADKYKFSALKNLYPFVTDYEGLEDVINNTFTFASDKRKAREIVGLD